ncbi:hypothetical protein LCGC14_2799120, partial [marine sediment metagenome]
EIASGEAFAADNVVAIVRQTISGTVGAIASSEVFETDNVLGGGGALEITGAGAIASNEAFEADNIIAFPAAQVISGTAGEIESGAEFENDLAIGGTAGPLIEEDRVKFSMRMGMRM